MLGTGELLILKQQKYFKTKTNFSMFFTFEFFRHLKSYITLNGIIKTNDLTGSIDPCFTPCGKLEIGNYAVSVLSVGHKQFLNMEANGRNWDLKS